MLKVYVDSGSSIKQDEKTKYNVEILPLKIMFGEKEYLGWKSENPRIFNYRDDSLTIFRKKLLTH